jgi:hypothetical protein
LHLSLASNSPLRRAAPYLLLIAIIAFYSAFLTRTYYWDGVLFSLYIERVHRGELPSAILFHPNHLVYSALGYLLYSAALACGLNLRALTLLQMLNVVVSVAAGLVVFVLAKRVTKSFIALFCWLLFGFGATWWKFSTDADSYILSVLFLLLTILLVVREPPRIITAAICHTIAMLFHELAIFAYFPVFAGIAFDSRWSKARRLSRCIAYLAGTGVWVGCAYLLCYSQTDRVTYPSLFAWITSYASDAGFTHSFAQITGPYLASYIKLFLGGKLSLIHDYFSVPVCLSLATSVCMLICAFVLLKWGRAASRPTNADPRAIAILWIWFLPSAIFLACWGPGSAFYKLFVWPPIVLLIGAYIASSKRLNQSVLAFIALAVAIAAWNFGAFIYPHSRTSADPVLVLAQTVDRQLPRNASVYYHVLAPDDWYLEYFAPGRKWLPLPPRIESWHQLLTSTRGPVCLETTALDELERNPRTARMGLEVDPTRRWTLVNGRHNIRLECVKSTF